MLWLGKSKQTSVKDLTFVNSEPYRQGLDKVKNLTKPHLKLYIGQKNLTKHDFLTPQRLRNDKVEPLYMLIIANIRAYI